MNNLFPDQAGSNRSMPIQRNPLRPEQHNSLIPHLPFNPQQPQGDGQPFMPPPQLAVPQATWPASTPLTLIMNQSFRDPLAQPFIKEAKTKLTNSSQIESLLINFLSSNNAKSIIEIDMNYLNPCQFAVPGRPEFKIISILINVIKALHVRFTTWGNRDRYINDFFINLFSIPNVSTMDIWLSSSNSRNDPLYWILSFSILNSPFDFQVIAQAYLKAIRPHEFFTLLTEPIIIRHRGFKLDTTCLDIAERSGWNPYGVLANLGYVFDDDRNIANYPYYWSTKGLIEIFASGQEAFKEPQIIPRPSLKKPKNSNTISALENAFLDFLLTGDRDKLGQLHINCSGDSYIGHAYINFSHGILHRTLQGIFRYTDEIVFKELRYITFGVKKGKRFQYTSANLAVRRMASVLLIICNSGFPQTDALSILISYYLRVVDKDTLLHMMNEDFFGKYMSSGGFQQINIRRLADCLGCQLDSVLSWHGLSFESPNDLPLEIDVNLSPTKNVNLTLEENLATTVIDLTDEVIPTNETTTTTTNTENLEAQAKQIKALQVELISALHESWFGATHSHVLLIKALVETRGLWKFKFTHAADFFEVTSPLVDFLANASQENRFIACQVISDILAFFPCYLEEEVFVNYPDIQNTFWSKEEAKAFVYLEVRMRFVDASLGTLPEPLILEVSEAFFELKAREFILRIQQDEPNKKTLQTNVPCFLIAQDLIQAHVEPFFALFDTHGSLCEITLDQKDKSSPYLKPFCDYTAKGFKLPADKLADFRNSLRVDSGQPIKALLLARKNIVQAQANNKTPAAIPTKAPSPAKEAREKSPLKQKAKRKLEEADPYAEMMDLLKHPAKRVFHMPSLMSVSQPQGSAGEMRLTGAHHPLSEVSKKKATAPSSFTSSISTAEAAFSSNMPTLMPFAFSQFTLENLWQQNNELSLDAIESAITSASMKRAVLKGHQPLDYPVISLLKNLGPLPNLPTYHPLLKEYQAKEASSLVNFALKGLSKLLAFEMGLGKTYVYAEFLIQMLTRKKQSSLLILPLSIIDAVKEDLLDYVRAVKGEAWRLGWLKLIAANNNERALNSYLNSFILQFQNSQKQTFHLLRALAAMSQDPLHFEKLCQDFYNRSSTRRPICFESISLAVSKHVKHLQVNHSSNAAQLHFIKDQIKSALKAYQVQVQKLKEVVIEEEMDDPSQMDLWIEHLLAGGDLQELPIWKWEGDKNIGHKATLLQCNLAGSLLEIDSSRLSHPPLHYHEERLTLLRELDPENFVQASKEHAELKAFIQNVKDNHISPQVFISTHTAISKIPAKEFASCPLAAVVVDEAQNAHTRGTGLNLCLENFAKNKDASTSLLLVSGTPLENNFTEMWDLLALANRMPSVEGSKSAFSDITLRALHTVLEHSQRCLLNLNRQELEASLLKSFAHMENLKNSIVLPLVAKKEMLNASIVKDWNCHVPVRKDEIVKVQLPIEAYNKLTEIEKQIANKQLKFFQIDSKIKQLLFGVEAIHFQVENENIQKIFKTLREGTTQEKESYIQRAPTLKALLECSSMQKVMEEKKSAIIITEHLAVAKIIELALKDKFSKHAPNIQCFNGDLTSPERKNMVKWFKEVTSAPKFLVLMQKAGGVGLNLPEAQYVFKTTLNYNPAIDAQAIARALRVGHTGVKTIVTFSHGLFLEAHYAAVQKKKQAWNDFFWNGNNGDALLQFKQWCNVVLAECFQSCLNATKSISAADSKRTEMAKLLEEIKIQTCPDDLKYIVENTKPQSTQQTSSMPSLAMPIAQQSPSKDNPLKTIAVASSKESSLATNAPKKATLKPNVFKAPAATEATFPIEKSLKEADWIDFPIPAKSMEEALCYFQVLQRAPQQLLKDAINDLKTNLSYRTLARQGLTACSQKIADTNSPFLKLYQWMNENLSKEPGKVRADVYSYKPSQMPLNGQFEHLESSAKWGNATRACLYKPSSLNKNGSEHFDILWPEIRK